MSVAKVLRLDEHRDRRLQRLRLADAMFRADRNRRAIFRHLAEAAELSGADRVATVWIDEYGPGLVHPHAVVDLLSDRPRRAFQIEPLTRAWEMGVPGAHDDGVVVGSTGPSTFAIALGSDGARAWFVVVESVAPRPPLDDETRDRIMFLAGECSAIVLHRDLDVDRDPDVPSAEARFAGWPILKDLEGREDDEGVSRRIAQRFVVARLIRSLLDDDLTMAIDRRREQARRARSELARDQALHGREQRLWARALTCYEELDLDLLGRTLADLGEMAEARDHFHGCLELYRMAYEVSAAIGAPEAAAHVARLRGRLLRRRARWADATTWYGAAHAIAAAASLTDLAARALSGLGVIKKDMGNIPAAREALAEALSVATGAGSPDTVATVHAEILGLEKVAGNLELALDHGWLAVATFDQDEVGRTRCLAVLAGALADYGDREAAEDAWTIVAHTSDERFYRVYAHDALAYLAALRKDGNGFDAQAKLCDDLDWENGPHSAKAEILYYRGISCRELGRFEAADTWLRRASEFAEEHNFNRVHFRAEQALVNLGREVEEQRRPTPAAPSDVREGVRAMRLEVVGA